MRSLFILILLMPIFAFAEDVDIRVRYPTGQIKPEKINLGSPAQRAWMNNQFKSGTAWYADERLNARMFTEMGAKANSTMPVVVQNKVAKKSVMVGLLKNARTGAKLGAGRAGWYGTAFLLVVDLLATDENIEKTAFYWSDEKGDFVKDASYKIDYFIGSNPETHIGQSTLSKPQFDAGLASVKSRVQGSCMSYENKINDFYKSENLTFQFDKVVSYQGELVPTTLNTFQCFYMPIGGEAYQRKSVSVYLVKDERTAIPITQSEFDNIVIPTADYDPSSFVNASRPSQSGAVPDVEYEETRAVAGSSVQTNPYTDPVDGKAKEAKFTINSDGTSATISIQNRPDLQGDTEAAPVPEPLPETKPDTGGETTPETEQTPFCELYPDVLACQKMGDGSEAESIFSDIKIPEITNPVEFKLDNFLPDNGSCPAPKTYSTSHGSIIYSYEKHCDVARTLRPFLIAFASVTALYLIFFRKA